MATSSTNAQPRPTFSNYLFGPTKMTKATQSLSLLAIAVTAAAIGCLVAMKCGANINPINVDICTWTLLGSGGLLILTTAKSLYDIAVLTKFFQANWDQDNRLTP